MVSRVDIEYRTYSYSYATMNRFSEPWPILRQDFHFSRRDTCRERENEHEFSVDRVTWSRIIYFVIFLRLVRIRTFFGTFYCGGVTLQPFDLVFVILWFLQFYETQICTSNISHGCKYLYFYCIPCTMKNNRWMDFSFSLRQWFDYFWKGFFFTIFAILRSVNFFKKR